MSTNDKNAVLLAAKKLKKTQHKPEDTVQSKSSGNKNFKNDTDDAGIVGGILNAVSNLKRRD